MKAAILSRYPGYVITEDGRVQGPSKAWLMPWPDRDGYLRLKPCVRGRNVNARVHVMVCLAFHGDPPSPLHQVRHLNGLRTDNRAENLAWGTAKDNGTDRIRHGTSRKGEAHNLAKLTWAEVRQIRQRYEPGRTSQRALAAEFGVAQSQIGSILHGKTWIEEVSSSES
jgi:hypothetical protein